MHILLALPVRLAFINIVTKFHGVILSSIVHIFRMYSHYCMVCQLYSLCQPQTSIYLHIITIYSFMLLCACVCTLFWLQWCWIFHAWNTPSKYTGDKYLTHWGRDKMADILQTAFSNEFFGMKMHEFRLRFRWNLLLMFELTKRQCWFR